MDGRYKDYLDIGAKEVVGILSDSKIEEAEKELLMDAYRKRLQENHDVMNHVESLEVLVRRASMEYLDERISEITERQNATDSELSLALQLCMYRLDLRNYFRLKELSDPTEKSIDIENCMSIIRKRIDNQTVCKGSVACADSGLDANRRAQGELSVQKYDSVAEDPQVEDPQVEDPQVEDPQMEDFQMEGSQREKTKRVKVIIYAALAGMMLLALFLMVDLIKNKDEKIRLPFDTVYALGLQYDTVAEKLKRSGFTNIQCISDASGWQKGNAVLSVSIDGQSSYRMGTYYDPDVSIVITYSSDEREDVSEFLLGWKNAEYTDIVGLFKDKGYTQVSINKEDTSETNQENRIATMSINGANYRNGHCFVPKDAPICITYYSLKISLDTDNTAFVGQDYQGVVANLKKIGFRNVQTEAVTGGWLKENSVISVTINNQTQYSLKDTYLPDAKIVVKYSAGTRTEITSYLTDWKTKEYTTIKTILKNLGFSDVTLIPLDTMVEKNKNRISNIKLNGEDYTTGACFLQKTAPVVIEYYSLKITVGRSASEYKNQPYSDVVAELQKKGFTNIKLYRANDLITGWFIKEGSIAAISINGNKFFSDQAAFGHDDEVVIVVHTFRNKGCRDITLVADEW